MTTEGKKRRTKRGKGAAPGTDGDGARLPGESAEDATPVPATPADAGEAAEAAPPLPTVLVGIGASAGGPDALARLLPGLQGDGLAYVVAQHLPADQTHRFVDAIRERSPLPVRIVEADMPVEPATVFLAPPHTLVEVADGRFLLSRRAEPPRPVLPIDHLLYSVANAAGSPGVAVLLSGVGTDGIAGLREVKAAGGIILVQDPTTAAYDALPRAAVEAGLADRTLSPEEIAAELPRLRPLLGRRLVTPRRPGDEIEVSDLDLEDVFDVLRTQIGVDFSQYKPGTIRRRIQRRMVLNRLDSRERYLLFLRESPAEVKELYQDLLIHVTRFFREPASFDALAELVFPELLADRRLDDPLRVWVPGCSTGEEAYSVAISLLEYLGERAAGYQIQIFASDLSESAVATARAGLYPESIAEDLTPERLRRFFHAHDGGYRVAKPVRDLCVFTRHDLTRDPPFSRLDVVMCRNVLIYLGSALQRRVMALLHYALKPDGFLVLGSAESVGTRGDLFRVVDKRHSIYRRKLDGGPPAALAFPRETLGAAAAGARRTGARGTPEVAGHQADRLLLDRYAPPAVIVDSRWNIVQTRGATGHFLELAPGEATLDLLRMAREGLLHALRAGLHEARLGDRPVRKEDLRVRADGAVRVVDLEVLPLGPMAEARHYLVLFHERARPVAPTPDETTPEPADEGAEPAAAGADPTTREHELRGELDATRSYLQAMIQDLEAANEELQSANEEILSANEELQSTNEELDTAKEELQSTNEELHTLNEEVQGRNDELARVNSDLTNLLASMQVAVVMVDDDLRIRRFTPMAEKVLNLIPTDVGRPIGHIKPNVEVPDLEALIRKAIDEVETVEREVRSADGAWLLLRVRSYKDTDNRIDGAVLSLFDIAERKSHEGEVSRARSLWGELLQLVRQPLAVLDHQLRVCDANASFRRLVTESGLVEGRRLTDLGDGGWDVAPLRDLLDASDDADPVLETTLTRETPEGDRVAFVATARRLSAMGGGAGEVLLLAIEEPAPREPRRLDEP